MKTCDDNKIINPISNRCVLRRGLIGKKIINNNMKTKENREKLLPNFNGTIKKKFSNIWIQTKQIGFGGYGEVYVTCIYNDCSYVMKIQKITREFRREVKYLYEFMDTGYTPKIYDAWEYEGQGYIVMEKMSKTTTKLTKKEKYNQIKKIFKFLHSKNIVFFDLHPGNVMYKDGRAFLIDFGLLYQFKNNRIVIKHLHSRDYGYFNFSKGKQLDMLNLDEYFGNKDQRKKARNILELMWFKNEKEN